MSKVVFKMSFKHPNFKDTASKNVGHVEYIATRPGTDKTITENDLKKELGKGIEDLSSDDETYVKYIGERPNSHGLFGQDGIEDLKKVKEELSNVESFVWRGIVSLKEEDAKNLGYLNKDKWQDMLRKKVPDMASEMKIPVSNLRWVAAVHMEKGHPHAHIMLWEKEPRRTVGVTNTKTLDNIRKMFTDEIFEEERFQLLNEKNIMRDLIRDLAQNDISKASQLIKEVKATGQELSMLMNDINQEGIAPKLYSEQEKALVEMIKNLSEKLPGKGRVALKFMPEDIKEEVRSIADYILKQPEFAASLEKKLIATEELTKIYTGKDDAIEKARNNTYNDMRDRICQIILKGAVESQRENIFYVDKDLSEKAVDFIKNMNNKINLVFEQTKVFNEIATVFIKAGYDDEDILKILKDFSDVNSISKSEDFTKDILNQARVNISKGQDIDFITSSKRVDYYLSVLKLSGIGEKEVFNHINKFIKKDSEELILRLENLKENGFLKKIDEEYKLTNKGIDEILKVKDLDRAEKEILKMLEKDGEESPKISFNELLNNNSIFSNLHNKNPEEFRLGKFDTKVRLEFGHENKVNLKDLEDKIYKRYTDDELNTNVEKAEKEFDILKNRIEKLALNGYVEFDRETGIYSFTDDTNKYFEFDEEKEIYVFTDEAIKKLGISEEMEFTRYDANITLSYIDRAEEGILTSEQLKKTLYSEIVNREAQIYYDRFTDILDTELIERTKQYISVDEEGNLSSTQEGKWLGIDLNKLNKYFKEAEGSLTDEKLKDICKTDQEYEDIKKQLESHVKKGHVEKDSITGVYKINSTTSDINKLLYQIYKEGGSVNRANLKEILERNIPNKEAEKQFKYLTYRLDNLKKQGYLTGEEKHYKLTLKGIEKRQDILVPERSILKNTLNYLNRLGFIVKTDEEEYQITDKYYKYMKTLAIAKEEKITRESANISKDIYKLIDRTQDKINVGKIERCNEKIARDKYINGNFESTKTDYESIRAACNVSDTISKTINKLSTTLLVSGVDLEDTKKILNDWNIRSNSNIDPEKLNEIIDKAYKIVADNNLWGKTTIISSKEWKDMFESLGLNDNIPTWIYKGENWEAFNRSMGLSIINDIWKSAWKELERQRMQTENQAEYMKKQLNKQQTANQSKEAIKEQIRKSKDRSSLYREDEWEL